MKIKTIEEEGYVWGEFGPPTMIVRQNDYVLLSTNEISNLRKRLVVRQKFIEDTISQLSFSHERSKEIFLDKTKWTNSYWSYLKPEGIFPNSKLGYKMTLYSYEGLMNRLTLSKDEIRERLSKAYKEAEEEYPGELKREKQLHIFNILSIAVLIMLIIINFV